jgi:glycosyltransferase involved in cell wall biosynthesis
MTSRVEGWGLALTEAMQAGAVPIAFDSYASLRDIVEDGKTGIIVPNGNIEAFATSVINLMRDPMRRQCLAANAVAAVQRFRLDAVLDQWEAIL